MFGDVYQLPPVVEENLAPYFENIHGGHFFFNALVWREAEFKIFELTQIFRQKDPVFKDILNAVRDGTVVDSQIKHLNERHGIAVPDEGTITLAPTNSLVTNINQRKLDQLPGEERLYKATITREMKRSVFPTEENLYLKKDAQIVLLKNDMDKRWVNGTVGKIEELFDDHIDICVNNTVYTLEQNTWEEIAYTYDPDTHKVEAKTISSFTQYPIRLAWALTIHKSQGQTYESVALDLTTGTFAAGQMYVALSRATGMEGLYLKMPVQRKHIIVDAKVTAFMSRRETIKVEVAEEPIAETCIQNQIDIVKDHQEEGILYAQNHEKKRSTRGGKREGAGRKRKEDLERICVKLSKEQIEKTNDVDRSELIRNLLDANGISDVLAGKFYTYLLMRPDGTVFYIGKGHNNRIDDHEKEAKKGMQSSKCDIIRQVWAEGKQIIKQKVAFFDDEELACRFEGLLISFFGGTLTNTELKNGRSGSREGAGRKSNDLKHVSIKLEKELIEKTKDIDRSALINKLLREHFGINE